MPGDPGLLALLRPEVRPRRLAPDIWSVVPPERTSQPYDRSARLYDRLIGSRLYNRVAWGTSPAAYTRFAAAAVGSGNGPMLDAGCGTLVSTAEVHATSGRPTVLVDLSSGMLAAARDRLVALSGGVPAHLVLLQADLTDLPFRAGVFGSVLCPGVAHLLDDVAGLVAALARVGFAGSEVRLSSLVAERWIGRHYLAALHRAGEVARPRTLERLATEVGAGTVHAPRIEVDGCMAFVTLRVAAAG